MRKIVVNHILFSNLFCLHVCMFIKELRSLKIPKNLNKNMHFYKYK